jgi:arsenical pump membrane protein
MPHILIWIISAASILLMLLRPFKTPEFVWVSAGALLLCLLQLIPLSLAGKAVAEGLDVYLFLTGMMLLSELAKDYGVFAWMAHYAVRLANRSSMRLFTSIYVVGVVVTIFMSNDATAVVLTPAVLSAVKRAKAPPLPYLLSCALVANAASFVLPISNPANLVVFNSTMPPLHRWLAMFSLPSLVAIIITYVILRWYCYNEISAPCEGSTSEDQPLRNCCGCNHVVNCICNENRSRFTDVSRIDCDHFGCGDSQSVESHPVGARNQLEHSAPGRRALRYR